MIRTQKLAVSKKRLKTIAENSPKKEASSPSKQNSFDVRQPYPHKNKLGSIKDQHSCNTRQFAQLNTNIRKTNSKHELKLNFNKTCIVEATQQSDPDQVNNFDDINCMPGNSDYRKRKQQKEQKQLKPMSSRSVGKLRKQTPSPIKVQQQSDQKQIKRSPLMKLKIPHSSRLIQTDITPSQTSRTINLNLSTSIQMSKNRTTSKPARYSYVNNNSADADEDRIENYTNRKQRQVEYRIKSQHINNMHREIQNLLQIINNKGNILVKDEQKQYKKQTKQYNLGKYEQLGRKRQRQEVQKSKIEYQPKNEQIVLIKCNRQRNQENKHLQYQYLDRSSKKYNYSKDLNKVSEFNLEQSVVDQTVQRQDKISKQKLQQKLNDKIIQTNKRVNKQTFVQKSNIKNGGNTRISNNLLDTTCALDKQIYEDYLQKYSKMVTSYTKKQTITNQQQKSQQKSPYVKDHHHANNYPAMKPKQFKYTAESTVPTRYHYVRQNEQSLQQRQSLSRRKYVDVKHAPQYDQRQAKEERKMLEVRQQQSHLMFIQQQTIKRETKNNEHDKVQENQGTQLNYDYEYEEDSSYIDIIDKEIIKIKDRIMTSEQVTRQMQDKYLLATLKDKDKGNLTQLLRQREEEKRHTARFAPTMQAQSTLFTMRGDYKQSKNMDTYRKQARQIDDKNNLIYKEARENTSQHKLQNMPYTESRVQNISKHRDYIEKYRENIVNRQLIQEEQRVNIEHEIIGRKVAAYFSKQIQLYAAMRPYREAICNKQQFREKGWEQLSEELSRLGYSYKANELKCLLELSPTESNPFSVAPSSSSSQCNQVIEQLAIRFIESQAHWDAKIESCLSSEHYEQIMSQYYFRAEDIDLNKKGFIAIQDLVCFVNLYDQKFYRNRDFIMFINKFRARTNANVKNQVLRGTRDYGRIEYHQMENLLFRPVQPHS